MVNKCTAELTQPSSWKLLQRLFRGYISRHSGKLSLAIVSMVLIAAMTAAYARMMEPLVDKVLVDRSTMSLFLVPIAFIVIAIIKAIATYTQSYLMGVFGQRIIADIQNNLFSHLVYSDIAFFYAKAKGALISSFLNDANLLREALTKALTGITKDSLTLVFLVVVLFLTDWQLALIAIIGFPLSIIPVRNIGKRMRKASIRNQERTSDFSAILNEAFSGARQIKAYTMEEGEIKRTKEANERRLNAMFRVVRTRAAATPIIEVLGGIAVAAVVFYAAGFGEAAARLTAGQFVTFIAALGLSYQPLRSIANLNTALQEGLAAAQRLFTIMDTSPSIVDQVDAPHLEIKNGVIRFENVSYAYDGMTPAISNVSFEAHAGKKIAIIGPSGAGKSTILNLIPRFFDVTKGCVLIDEQDIRTVTQFSLRSAIAFVSQDSNLFNSTIRENIAYGKPDATNKQIVDAAREAAALDFLNDMPNGLDTVVGEEGIKLSGGQRQRISIARAMLKDAPILLLDEATSSLDTESEKQLQAALNRLIKGRTTIVVAHRLSTVADADLILAIEKGTVVESGTHEELMAKKGLYARLYAEDTPAKESYAKSFPKNESH